MKMDFYRSKYPTFPDKSIPCPKYEHNKANGLTAAIVDYVNLLGGFASRISSTGLYREGIGWTKSNTRKGISDIIAVYSGKAYAIEVKIGKDRQSEDQRSFEVDWERAGGLYIIAKSFDDFYEDFNNSLNIKK